MEGTCPASRGLRNVLGSPAVRAGLLGAVCLLYAAAALYPFRWAPPRLRENAAAPRPGGGWRFESPGIAFTPGAPAWVEAAKSTGKLSVFVRAKPYQLDQKGPARIFTLSKDPSLRNLTVAQEGRDLVVRVRTPETSLNGKPGHVIPCVFEENEWRDLKVEIEDAALRVEVNGRLALAADLPPSPLRSWDGGYRVALGNELTGRRAWRGEIARAAVASGGAVTDYAGRGTLARPARYWALPHAPRLHPFRAFDPAGGSWRDLLLNFGGFLAFGAAATLLWPGRRRLLWIGLFAAGFSLLLECSQLLFEDRFPSSVDFLANSVGALCGALVVLRMSPAAPCAAGRLGRRSTMPGPHGGRERTDLR